MSAAPYTPREETLPARVVGYFKRLPDEELSTADIALKWHADQKNVNAQLSKSVEAGLLARDGQVYTAGPNIGTVDLSPSALVESAKPTRRQPRVTPDIDIEAITFEDHVPIHTVTRRLVDRWMAKIKQMRTGQSFPISMEHRHGVNGACTNLRKEGMLLTIRREGEMELRVYCVKAMAGAE